jgi:hypothetical protein
MLTYPWISGWRFTPPELVSPHLRSDPQFIRALRKDKVPVVPA